MLRESALRRVWATSTACSHSFITARTRIFSTKTGGNAGNSTLACEGTVRTCELGPQHRWEMSVNTASRDMSQTWRYRREKKSYSSTRSPPLLSNPPFFLTYLHSDNYSKRKENTEETPPSPTFSARPFLNLRAVTAPTVHNNNERR